jgi:hypothetical protein
MSAFRPSLIVQGLRSRAVVAWYRAQYIEKIMGLSHDSQSALKATIESAMARVRPLATGAPVSPTSAQEVGSGPRNGRCLLMGLLQR